MQRELEAEFPQLDVQFLGVNQSGMDYGNATFTEGVDLPWLQDVDADGDGRSDAWNAWDVLPRDVVIVNSENLPVATYNLTTHDITQTENYDALKQLIVDIASSEQETGTINGHVYFDVNDNGTFDAAEAPIGGVAIELAGTTSSGQDVRETTRTQTDGSFSFQGLAAGTYTISQHQPAMTIDGRDTAGTSAGSTRNDAFTIELGVGEDASGYLFGERGRTASAITLSDFLASTPKNTIEVMAGSSEVEWYCLRGEWQAFYFADVQLAPAGADGDPPARPNGMPQLDLSFRNDHGHTLEGQWPAESNQLNLLGREGDQVLLRAHGELVDITQLERDAQSAEGEALSSRPVSRVQVNSDWPETVDQLWTGDGERDELLWG